MLAFRLLFWSARKESACALAAFFGLQGNEMIAFRLLFLVCKDANYLPSDCFLSSERKQSACCPLVSSVWRKRIACFLTAFFCQRGKKALALWLLCWSARKQSTCFPSVFFVCKETRCLLRDCFFLSARKESTGFFSAVGPQGNEMPAF